MTPATTLRELFEETCARSGARRCFKRKTGPDTYSIWTFADVAQSTQRFTRALAALGVRKGDRIAILSENRPEWPIAFITIVSAGAVAVPLDRHLTPAEIINLLTHAGARFIVAPSSLNKTLLECLFSARCVEKIISMDEAEDSEGVIGYATLERLGASHQVDPARVAIEPGDTACLVYTSGTTGIPKGIMITHGNLVFEAGALARTHPLADDDVVLSVLPLNHLYELTAGFIVPFASGSEIVYVGGFLPSKILEAFRTCSITRLVGVPLLFSLFYDEVAGKVEKLGHVEKFLFFRSMEVSRSMRSLLGINPGKVLFKKIHSAFGGTIRQVVSGGAPLDPDMAQRILDAGFPISVGYGLSETSPVVATGDVASIPRGSVGRPLEGVEIRIDKPGPDGIGEVCVRGPNVMAGYFRDPELTREAIREGWFHTGDLGYADKDGFLFITGRAKEMIVTHGGKKLFPEDLERQYAAIPGVKEMCVVGQLRLDGKGEEPVAIIVADPQAAGGKDPEGVRESIRATFRDRSHGLPALRIVRHLLFWDQPLPKTSTMKVKRLTVQQIINEGLRGATWTGPERRSHERHDFSVTQAREIDVLPVVKLLAQSAKASARSPEEVRRCLETATAVWSVWRQGEILGFVRVLSDLVDVAIIQDLTIRPDWQHRGIGTILLRRILGDARMGHVTQLWFKPPLDDAFLRRFGLTPRVEGLATRGKPLAKSA